MNVRSSAVFRHADNIVTRKVMDETLLVPISGEMASMDSLYSLNDTGAFLWQSFDGKRSLSDIGRKMAEQYDASIEVIEADLIEITAGLAEAGLLISEGEN
ncbi:MAG: PqqD family protein [Candidatus Electrothrix scaldis]|nr:MAG: PqqD family protein [Candidatus Electrothrix sp. GW3-3]